MNELISSQTPGDPVVCTNRFAIPGVGGAGAAISVVKMDPQAEVAPGVISQWLRGEEVARLQRFKVVHAQADFAAGRIAAKSALRALHPASPGEWEITRGIWHQPCVRGPAGGLAVTLAHSGGVAVAVAHDDRWKCGIDLEATTRDAADVVESQVTENETRWARAGGDQSTARWMLLWTAREALGKCLGTGLLFPEALLATSGWAETPEGWQAGFEGSDLLSIRAVLAARFTLSWVMPATAANDPAITGALRWLAQTLD